MGASQASIAACESCTVDGRLLGHLLLYLSCGFGLFADTGLQLGRVPLTNQGLEVLLGVLEVYAGFVAPEFDGFPVKSARSEILRLVGPQVQVLAADVDGGLPNTVLLVPAHASKARFFLGVWRRA